MGRAGGVRSGHRSGTFRIWLNPKLSPEARPQAALAAMTLDEKLRLVFGYSDQAITDVAKVPDESSRPSSRTMS